MVGCDGRFSGLTRAQASLNNANNFWARAGITFGDLRVEVDQAAAIGGYYGDDKAAAIRQRGEAFAQRSPGRLVIMFSSLPRNPSSRQASVVAGHLSGGVGGMARWSRDKMYMYVRCTAALATATLSNGLIRCPSPLIRLPPPHPPVPSPFNLVG